jgi:rhamnose transport system ATP-binding protein
VPGLEFHDIHKSFGAVRALRGVSLSVAEGETHALIGENGAGKSTLLKILAGIVAPDSGDVRWHDRRLSLSGPREALAHGIGMVYQETLMFPNLTVSGNIFAGREITGRGGTLREREMRARTRELLARLHLSLAADAPMEHLSAAHAQLVQVARALAFDCRVLVLDEPTTALTLSEANHLFRVLDDLRTRGVTILYVSHRIPEVFRLCDRISVLRDGQYVGTYDRAAVTSDEIVRAMVGRDLPPRAVEPVLEGGEVVLEVRGVTRPPSVADASLTARRGEIVGLFGLVGSGRSELLETVFGLRRATRGEVLVGGRRLAGGSVVEAAGAGIALVPEDRQHQALLFNLALRHNLVLPRAVTERAIVVRGPEERSLSERLVAALRIKTPGVDVTPDRLSGGNQQKVVLARWLAIAPRVLLLDEPTKGVDVGAKDEIHAIIRQKAAEGAACVVVSSDLPEVLAIAHRIVVMREGRMQGELSAAQANEESVMRLATARVVTNERAS